MQRLKGIKEGAFFLAGFLLAACIFLVWNDNSKMRVIGEITMGDILSALVTICIAVLVVTALERQADIQKAEKELVLRQLDRIIQSVNEFESASSGGILAEIFPSLKKLSMNCNALDRILTLLKCSKRLSDQCNFADNIKEIRKLATDTPIKSLEGLGKKMRKDSKVRQGIMSLAESERKILEGKINDLKNRLLEAQIQIYRH